MNDISGSYEGKLTAEDACTIDAALDPSDIVLSLDSAEQYTAASLSVSSGFMGLRVRGDARLNVERLESSDSKNDLVQLWNGGVSIEHYEASHTLPCLYCNENHPDVFQAFAKRKGGNFEMLPVFDGLYIGSVRVVVECHGEEDKKNGFIFSELCEYRNVSLFSKGLEFISNSSAPYFLDATSFQNAVIGSESHPIDPDKVSGKAIRIGGQKSGAPRCKNIAIHAYAGLKVVLSADAKRNTQIYVHERPKVTDHKNESFSEWIDSLKNLNAPAVTERDIEAAADRLSISPAMVAAVSTVESRGKGFNSDGSARALLERHKVYKYAKEYNCLDEMLAEAGSGVCSETMGGYVGGVAEYERIKRVGRVNSRVAMLSPSFGAWQIMGFNHALVGYDTPEAMYEAFQESEKNQLNAFVEFIIAKDLAKHLQEAERLADAGKSPLKPLDAFADGYNGIKHKRYDLKIAAAYESEKRKREGYQVRPVTESKTVQGGATATIGTVGAGVLTAKELLESLRETRELAEGVSNDLGQEVDAIKEKIAEPNYILWAIIAFLVLAQFGVFTSLWARIKDRVTGLNL